jgi:sorting nexin-29
VSTRQSNKYKIDCASGWLFLLNIILERLKKYWEEILGGYQCSIRPQRGTTDQIFVGRQILEEFYARDIDLYLLFIDFKNAFDGINQKKKLLESLVSFGIPRKIERLVKMTLEGAQAKVIVNEKISALFTIDKGVRQGYGFSATMFNLTLHKALKKTWNKTVRF